MDDNWLNEMIEDVRLAWELERKKIIKEFIGAMICFLGFLILTIILFTWNLE